MKPAIRLSGVSKRYLLYGSPIAQALGAFGIRRSGLPVKTALDGIDLTVGHGEKVGVIGRNGSGKTTLLKLVIGHTRATTGTIEVHGGVQAMMQGGFGFHDDLTGLENATNALIYGGFDAAERAIALEDIVDFVELGEFIEHPVGTYSLGMRARLEFATATAIRPDILAIDEVLGAGDGYFVRKCADRMRRVIADGTLLLVSHALDQVVEYCTRAIWLDAGRVRADGPARDVVREYQRFMARDEAAVQDRIRAGDRALTRDAVPRAMQLFGAGDAGVIIDSCEVGRDAIETGDGLAVRIGVSSKSPRVVEPVLLGFSEHGAFLFEAVGGAVRVEGRQELVVGNPRVGIGVGDYALVPALREEGRTVALGPMTVALRIMPTNWSDPPLVHLEGEWRDGDGRSLEAKVSAWV